jgi:hypothetical protein
MRYCVMMWPGFARAWWRGEIYGVALAVLFAVCFCLAWTASFVWPDWFSPSTDLAIWIGIAGFAIWSFVTNLIRWSTIQGLTPSTTAVSDTAFRSAQQAYLRGEFYEAEATLYPTLAAGLEDIESALLLASILRRTGRPQQALDTLNRLSLLDRAAGWHSEIFRERAALAKLEA